MTTSVSDKRHKHAINKDRVFLKELTPHRLGQRQVVALHDSDLDPAVTEDFVDGVIPLGPRYRIPLSIHQRKCQVSFFMIVGYMNQIVKALLQRLFCRLVFFRVKDYPVVGPSVTSVIEPGRHDDFTNILPLGGSIQNCSSLIRVPTSPELIAKLEVAAMTSGVLELRKSIS